MPAGGPPTVLIVEDSATTRQIVAMTFRNAGFLPVEVPSAQEAIAALRKLAADLVITDRGLPDASGYSVCRFIRSDRAYAHTKIILISGHDEAKADPDGFPGAYDAFLAKPFSLKDLLARGRELVVVGARILLAYRPPAGTRLRLTTDLVAAVGDTEYKEHCVQDQEILEIDPAGGPATAHVEFPEWWRQRVVAGGPPDFKPHPLEGQRALLKVEGGVARPRGLRVKASDEWPDSLVPPLCALLPGREVASDETVEASLGKKGTGKVTLRKVDGNGTATVALEFDLTLGTGPGAYRLAARGPAVFDAERGHLLSGTFDGTIHLKGQKGPANLSVRTVAG
jgi:CheY-like chemotaxis protein